MARLAGGHVEPGRREGPGRRHLADRQIDPPVEVLVNVEQPVEQRFGSGRADDLQMLLAGEPSGLHQWEQRRDVVEVVMRQENGRDSLVAGLGAGQPLEDAAATVDEEGTVAVVEEVARLHAVRDRHRAAGSEDGEFHAECPCAQPPNSVGPRGASRPGAARPDRRPRRPRRD